MKKLVFTLCFTFAFAYSLEFKPLQNTFDEYSAIFVAFDEGSTILQSYEKLVNTHGVAHKKALNSNDKDGCACEGLREKIELYKDYNDGLNLYLWIENKLIIKRQCWGAGDFYFELEKEAKGVKITKKFTRLGQ